MITIPVALFAPKIKTIVQPSIHAPHTAKVTFTFDDSFQSGITEAAPVLAKYGFPGVMYVSTGCVDNTGVCRSRFPEGKRFLTWSELKELEEKYHWEIGSHTQNHKPLTELTPEEKEVEIVGSKEKLVEHGFKPVSFASPQGDYDPSTLSIIMKHYGTHRGFKDKGNNDWLYESALLSVKQVQEGTSVEDVKKAVDSAIELQQWLILVFHDIEKSPSTDPEDYEYATAKLDEIAKYVKSKQDWGEIQTVTVKDVLSHSRPNLIENHSFEESGGDAWVVNSAEFVSIDYDNYGSYPSPKESAKMIGSATAANLHTALIPVEPGSKYEFRVYTNTVDQKSGELSFVIDEHAESGEWIRADWIGRVQPGNVAYVTSVYEPKSPSVRSIRIQANLSKNSEGIAYIDNYQLYKID